MIVSTHIKITISNNGAYWRNLSYGHCKQRDVIQVRVDELPLNSNKKVDCTCDVCGTPFSRQYQLLMRRKEQMCNPCNRKWVGTNADKTASIARLSSWKGSDHPRWRKDGDVFRKYVGRVHWLSRKVYVKNKAALNPNNYPRTLCGVEGGYQLDHIVSIKKAYDLGWTPEQCSDIGNLQLLPWKENRDKW